jgi:hypothetical protein
MRGKAGAAARSLVVKKVSKILALVSASMPLPVSRTEILMYLPSPRPNASASA